MTWKVVRNYIVKEVHKNDFDRMQITNAFLDYHRMYLQWNLDLETLDLEH